MADRSRDDTASKAKPTAKPNPQPEAPNELTAVAPDFEGRVSNRPSPPDD
jgi:hypothetical protein